MYRRSNTVIHSCAGDGLQSFNYLAKSEFHCSEGLLEFLNQIDSWKSKEQLHQLASDYDADELDMLLQDLVSCGALIKSGSDEERREQEFTESWQWGIPTAAMHFGLQNAEPMTVEASEELQVRKLRDSPQPPLYLTNEKFENTVELACDWDQDSVLALMARRRTNRDVVHKALSAKQLSHCLYAGMGITDQTSNRAGNLPLKMTPSGGARNPFEAYVLAQNVDNLEPGLYHYSAKEHNLGLINPIERLDVSAGSLIGNQGWMDRMPAIIFLVAFLERSMWKYQDPNAYRVMLIEAGHIGQNIMLAATDHELTACPSAALSHTEIKRVFDIEGLSRTPVYALGLGYPDQ